MTWLEVVHPSWDEIFKPHLSLIEQIEDQLSRLEIAPTHDLVFRAFSRPLDEMKVVIFGQDPYPNANHACGLAFSVPTQLVRLPQSLLNIFSELHSDLGGPLRTSGDLSDWFRQGVGLVNRVLTVEAGLIGSHNKLGWQQLTDSVARELGDREVVAILWGNQARQLEKHFPLHRRISSAHPSPLSAYRGFFGSRPFSKANELLAERGAKPINWLPSEAKEPREVSGG